MLWYHTTSFYLALLLHLVHSENWKIIEYPHKVNFTVEKSVESVSALSCVAFCLSDLNSQLISYEDKRCYCLPSEPTSTSDEIGLSSVIERTIDLPECVLKEYEIFESSGICLKFYTTMLNWTDALNQCQKDGGYLPELDSSDKYNTILNYTQQHNIVYIHVGGYDYGKGSQNFRWIRGGVIDPSLWNGNEPDNLNHIEYCVSLYTTVSDYGLYDVECEREQNFLCELIL